MPASHILGSVIKSVQKGISSASTMGTTVAISPVDVAKAIVSYRGFNSAISSFHGVTVVLTNATTLTLSGGESGVSKTVSWEVVEFF